MAISYEPVGEQQLKGKELPVPAWRAVRVTGMVGGASRYTGLEPPFEGRDEDLRLLKELFNATVREKRARLVTVIGQAGTGKSRLTREFEKYIDGLADLVYWHEGRSPAYGEGISFWALGEMVRSRAGLAERDDEVDDSPTHRRDARAMGARRSRSALDRATAAPAARRRRGACHGARGAVRGMAHCSSNAWPNVARW